MFLHFEQDIQSKTMVQNTAYSSAVAYSEMLFERKQFGNDRHHATRCRGYKVQSCSYALPCKAEHDCTDVADV